MMPGGANFLIPGFGDKSPEGGKSLGKKSTLSIDVDLVDL
jgi:hypothetical protein